MALSSCTEWILVDPHDGGPDADGDGDGDADVDGDADNDSDADADGDADVHSDADTDADADGDGSECEPGGHRCVDGVFESCGVEGFETRALCPLGCDAAAMICRVPSNVPESRLETLLGDHGDLTITSSAPAPTVIVDTDTGEISADGTILRAAGEGVDPATGIGFDHATQEGVVVTLGVFTFGSLEIEPGVNVRVEGNRGLLIHARHSVVIGGVLDLAAVGATPGPGGFRGGDPDMQGEGACGGLPGTADPDERDAMGGSGGGGHAGSGGDGAGSEHVGSTAPGGAGGLATCGTAELVPLLGGSGGGGGVTTVDPTVPGLGGGGGGAVQISSAELIEIGPTGGITVGGGGGGGSDIAAGAGGGSGGAVLLEAPEIIVERGAIIAANGGGGGAGDCG